MTIFEHLRKHVEDNSIDVLLNTQVQLAIGIVKSGGCDETTCVMCPITWDCHEGDVVEHALNWLKEQGITHRDIFEHLF